MKIIRTKHSKKSNGYWFLKGLIKIIDALVIFLTLGFFWSDWEYKFTKWYSCTHLVRFKYFYKKRESLFVKQVNVSDE